MNTRTPLIASALPAASLISGAAHAELQGRDLNGSIDSFEAYYDDDLNVTWLADANYAKTSGYVDDGLMTWANATTWAANLSYFDSVRNVTYTDWRLPTTTDTGTHDYNYVAASDGTDWGYNVYPASSEMAHMFFTELGNASVYTESPQRCRHRCNS